MMLLVNDIPERDDELAAWFNQLLTRDDFAKYLNQLRTLQAVSGVRPANRELESTLKASLPSILKRGFEQLSAQQLRQLLAQPTLIETLHEEVLTKGGTFWIERFQESQFGGRSRQQSVSKLLDEPSSTSKGNPAGVVDRQVIASQTKRSNRFAAPILSALATALVMLLVLAPYLQVNQGKQLAKNDQPKVQPVPDATGKAPTVAPTGWGWNKENAFAEAPTRTDYLKQLAAGAREWSKKKPETAVAAADRIIQFRQGCARLILAEHKPLNNADRAWLRERCQAWAKDITDHLVALEATGDVKAALEKMDATVNKLAAALEKRAEA